MFHIRALEKHIEALQGEVIEQGRLLALASTNPSPRAGTVSSASSRQQQQPVTITATRSHPVVGASTSKPSTPSADDHYGVRSGERSAVAQLWQPDAVALTIRQWWDTLEERVQGALDADDLGVYPSRESRGIGEQQSGAQWWTTFSSYSESDMKDLFYRDGTMLHDGQRCGKDEVKLKMMDRKM